MTVQPASCRDVTNAQARPACPANMRPSVAVTATAHTPLDSVPTPPASPAYPRAGGAIPSLTELDMGLHRAGVPAVYVHTYADDSMGISFDDAAPFAVTAWSAAVACRQMSAALLDMAAWLDDAADAERRGR